MRCFLRETGKRLDVKSLDQLKEAGNAGVYPF
jgi:hypothetical protein